MVQMQREHINLETLDKLVLDVLDVYSAKDLCVSGADVKRLILDGNIKQALSLLEWSCPQALQDLRLVFRLRRQQFIELVRSARHGSAEDIQAIACARDQLAPLALYAYPEAYCDFKKLLTLLLYAKTPEPSLPADMRDALDEGARQELAQLVDHTVRQHIGQQEPLLSLLLTYLLRLYSMHVANMSSSTKAQQSSEELEREHLVDALLSLGRDAAPLPPESGLGPSSFNEHDVNALIHCAGCTRRDAEAALKRSCNNLLAAFKAELARLRLNKPLLLELLHEYVGYRNLRPAKGASLEKMLPAEALHTAAGERVGPDVGEEGTSAMDIDMEGRLGATRSKSSPQGTGDSGSKTGTGCPKQRQVGAGFGGGVQGIGASGCDRGQGLSVPVPGIGRGGQGGPEGRVFAGGHAQGNEEEAAEGIGRLSVWGQMVWSQSNDVDFEGTAAAGGPMSGEEGLQGEGMEQAVQSVRQSAPRRSESQSPPGKVQRCHTGASHEMHVASELCAQDDVELQKHKDMSMVLQLAKEGKPAEMYEAVEALDPGFFAAHPALLFELRHCQLVSLLDKGDVSEALTLARTQLAPIADKEPSLQPSLKSAMANFLPGGMSSAAGQPHLSSVTSSIQAALLSRLGMEGPRLIKLMQALLARHRAWTRLEKYTDPFIADMHIDALREPPTVLTGSGMRDTKACVQGGSAPASTTAAVDTVISDASDDLSEDISLDGDSTVPEDLVLRLIEILEVPRHQAIDLLAQHEGDIEMAVVMFVGTE